MMIDSSSSHIWLLYYKFEEFLAVGKLSKVCSWHKNMGMNVQTHRYADITWIIFTRHALHLNGYTSQKTRSFEKYLSYLDFLVNLWLGGDIKRRVEAFG